jgi:hypothetical protein
LTGKLTVRRIEAEPGHVVELLDKLSSRLNLKVLTRWGLRPCCLKIRRIVSASLRPWGRCHESRPGEQSGQGSRDFAGEAPADV